VAATAAPASRRRLDRESRRSLMVDAAVEVFRGRVPAEVTFDEVAEAAQVSRALVYNYFGDRHGLLAAVHERVFAELQERVAVEIGDVTDFRSAVFGLVRAHVQFAAADLDRYRLALDALGGAGDHGAERLAAAVKGFGSGPTAELAARGEAAALGAMVTAWATSRAIDEAAAIDVIGTVLWAGLSDHEALGLEIDPFWQGAAAS
jgi:AcrR family transcriptional regulator